MMKPLSTKNISTLKYPPLNEGIDVSRDGRRGDQWFAVMDKDHPDGCHQAETGECVYSRPLLPVVDPLAYGVVGWHVRILRGVLIGLTQVHEAARFNARDQRDQSCRVRATLPNGQGRRATQSW